MEKFPIITTERLYLREIRETDIDSVFGMFSREEVAEHYDCYPFKEKSQAERWVYGNIDANKKREIDSFRWAISLLDNPDVFIGSCGFHNVNSQFFSFEVGYDLHPDYWGKGIMKEALSSILSFCFTNDFPMAVNRVSAMTDLDSPRSISVLTGLGFKEEGVLKEYGFWKDKFHDVRLFSISRKNWNEG